ncbi:MAG: hypothetical protein M1281_10940 [Chloroflexi bacterium]|nr:hypothetical protein [Chloroflexota bacterium]
MNNPSAWKGFFSWKVLLGGVLIASSLLGLIWLGAMYLRPESRISKADASVVTVVPAPTLTPVLPTPTSIITPTPGSTTPIPPPANGSIAVGVYVQIKGTGGDGLRLRSDPGTNGVPRFLGAESEVFHVESGPRQADGFTWWFLVAPYDKNRSGWAVSNYLTIIQNPS